MLSPVTLACIRAHLSTGQKDASFIRTGFACATQPRSFVYSFSIMAPSSDSLGSYPFSLSKPFVALDQSPGDVNNRIRDAHLLLALRNEDYDTQTSPQIAPAISLKKSPLGGAAYAVNSPHSPNSNGLPISVSGEVQGLRKRWLREHANLLQESISQVAKRARLSTTSGGDSLPAFEPTIIENGGNESSPSGSKIHSQSDPRSSKISDSDHGSASLTMSSTSSETRFSTT